ALAQATRSVARCLKSRVPSSRPGARRTTGPAAWLLMCGTATGFGRSWDPAAMRPARAGQVWKEEIPPWGRDAHRSGMRDEYVAISGDRRGGATQVSSSRHADRLPLGRFARLALVLRQVVVAGRAQFVRIEIVHGDGVEGQLAQLFQLPAFLGGDPALAHALVQLRLEVQ